MTLKSKTNGRLYTCPVKLLTKEQAKIKDVTGAFLTLTDKETKEQVLVMWNYSADDNGYDIVTEHGKDIIDVPFVKVEELPKELLDNALKQAEEAGRQAGEAR